MSEISPKILFWVKWAILAQFWFNLMQVCISRYALRIFFTFCCLIGLNKSTKINQNIKRRIWIKIYRSKVITSTPETIYILTVVLLESISKLYRLESVFDFLKSTVSLAFIYLDCPSWMAVFHFCECDTIGRFSRWTSLVLYFEFSRYLWAVYRFEYLVLPTIWWY